MWMVIDSVASAAPYAIGMFAIMSVLSGLVIPRALRKGPTCPRCAYPVDLTARADVCPECGTSLVAEGVLTPRLYARVFVPAWSVYIIWVAGLVIILGPAVRYVQDMTRASTRFSGPQALLVESSMLFRPDDAIGGVGFRLTASLIDTYPERFHSEIEPIRGEVRVKPLGPGGRPSGSVAIVDFERHAWFVDASVDDEEPPTPIGEDRGAEAIGRAIAAAGLEAPEAGVQALAEAIDVAMELTKVNAYEFASDRVLRPVRLPSGGAAYTSSRPVTNMRNISLGEAAFAERPAFLVVVLGTWGAVLVAGLIFIYRRRRRLFGACPPGLGALNHLRRSS